MARAYLKINQDEPAVVFDDIKAGLVALRMASANHQNLKLIVEENNDGVYWDTEYALVDGIPKEVLGSPLWWDRQDRVGEKQALEAWVDIDRYKIARSLLGGRGPTQAEMDLLTDMVQWLGTPVGSAFMREILASTKSAMRQ